VIAAVVLIAIVAIGSLAAIAVGQPLAAVMFAVGAIVGYVVAFLSVPALRDGRARATGAAIDDATSGWAEFHRELTRARRFDRSFAIVRLGPATSADDHGRIRDQVAAALRRIDRIWLDGDHILMLLPEANPTAVKATLDRVRAAVPEAIQFDPGIALFPQHGITSGSLIAAAYGASIEDVPTPIAAARPDLRGAVVAAVDGLVPDAGEPSNELASSGG
jgi:hypothetical protein